MNYNNTNKYYACLTESACKRTHQLCSHTFWTAETSCGTSSFLHHCHSQYNVCLSQRCDLLQSLTLTVKIYTRVRKYVAWRRRFSLWHCYSIMDRFNRQLIVVERERKVLYREPRRKRRQTSTAWCVSGNIRFIHLCCEGESFFYLAKDKFQFYLGQGQFHSPEMKSLVSSVCSGLLCWLNHWLIEALKHCFV